MINLEHGKLYLFVSTIELEPPAFGIFDCFDEGYILLKLMFCNSEMSRNRWLPDSYSAARKAGDEEVELFREIILGISRHVSSTVMCHDAPELAEALVELTRDEFTSEMV